MGSGKVKLLALIALVSAIGFVGSLYLQTQDINRRIAQTQREAASKTSPAPKTDLKQIEAKIAEMKTDLATLNTLKGLAKKETLEALTNLAVSGPAPKGGGPAPNVSKIVSEQVATQVADALKEIKKDLAAKKEAGPEAAKLAQDFQALKEQVDKLASARGGGTKPEEAARRMEAVEKRIGEVAKKLETPGASAGDVSEMKAKLEQANAEIAKVKADLAALAGKLSEPGKPASGGGAPEIIVQQGVLDTEKEGSDIKQKLRQMPEFREKFDRVFSVNLSSGAITVKPGYRVSYFVSPADLVIPSASVWSYRRTICQVDENGIVKCAVVFTRGERSRQSDEKGIVNFIVIVYRTEG